MKPTSKSTKIIEAKMSQTHAEVRFEKARKRLSLSLKNLEDVMKKKLHEEAIESRMISSHSESSTKIVEQSITIQNLTLEVNNLQNSLSELGRETEFLNVRNKIFAEKLKSIRAAQLGLIEEVENDLAKISDAIKSEEEL
jgi:hypothetical protein